MDCKFRFDLFLKGYRKDSDKFRNCKEDDSLVEVFYLKKIVKKVGNGEVLDLCSLVMGIFFGEFEVILIVVVYFC